jgi:hypothetical protein
MFRKSLILAGCMVLALVASANAQVWTGVAASGAIDESYTGNYATSQGALFFRSGATGNVAATLNVTNPLNSGNPSWGTLELVANGGAGGLGVGASATLYRQVRTTGATVSICTAVAASSGSTSTSTCTFSTSTFDFTNYAYFIDLNLGRTSTAQTVTAYSLRVF